MTKRCISISLTAAAILATAGCAGTSWWAPGKAGGPASPPLLPDYRTALAKKPQDVTAFFREWLAALPPTQDENGRVAFDVEGSQPEVSSSVERVLAAYEAYCGQQSGTLAKPADAPGRRCLSASGTLIAGLEVDVVHGGEFQQAELRFAVETGDRMRRTQALHRLQRAQVMQTLSENGPSGNVVLVSGEAFEAARFGRLSGPDYYAIEVPGRFLVPLIDTLSVRWTGDDVRILMRDGSVVTESGKAASPARSLVRLIPSGTQGVETEGMTFDAPFRFVTLEARSKQPRQVRLRDTGQLLEITVSPRPPALRGGALSVRPDTKEMTALTQGLVRDAHRAAKKLNVSPAPIDVGDVRVRDEVQRMGRNGPCSKSQSDAALKSGDLSLTEFYVCAQYRKESKELLGNDGTISPDKTPLVFLGRAARAPWFDFNGVLR